GARARRDHRSRDPGVGGRVAAAAGLQGHPRPGGRDPPTRERGRPDRPRGDHLAVQGRDRSDRRDPVEGHLRTPRAGDRLQRARRLHPGRDRHQERMNGDIILVIVIVTALVFDLTNGFHDTANVVATAISTRAIAPKVAVAGAPLLNFVGAFISLKVATTVGQGFVDTGAVTTTVVFAGLVGAIAWNIITWYFGLPSSSSHALIGGLVGAVAAPSGVGAVDGAGVLGKLIVPA